MPVVATATLLALIAALRSRRAALATTALVVGLTGAAFFRPLLDREPGSDALEHYAPRADGDSVLAIIYDAAGTPTRWKSRNDRFLPPDLAFSGELRPALLKALEAHLSATGTTLDDWRLIESRKRDWSVDGTFEDSIIIDLRGESGEYLLGWYAPDDDDATVFEPPLCVLPAALEVGASWTSRGITRRGASELTYEMVGRAVNVESHENEAGRFDDCLRVETALTVRRADNDAPAVHATYWFAPGAGEISWREASADGTLLNRGVVMQERLLADGPLPSPRAARAPTAAASDMTRWQWERAVDVRHSRVVGEPTMAPTWIPTEPPLVVVAAQHGGLTALAVDEDTPSVAWRFHTAGSIFGAPAWDAERGLLYFGATDKRLHAVDARGLFRWRFAADENVGTRPVVVGDVVVCGTEAGTVYGIDAAQGTLRWSRRLGGPVASSPLALGGIVVLGSDDGSLYALDAATGATRWQTAVGGPIELPPAGDSAGQTVFVADHDDGLAALNVADGTLLWSTPGVGRLSAPTVDEAGNPYVVEAGRLSAFDPASGRRRWSSEYADYAGAPVALRSSLFVVTRAGEVHRFAADGKLQQRWEAAADGSSFVFGPVAGDDALWLVDSSAVVYRLGEPNWATTVDIAWKHRFADPPLNGALLNNTPIPHGDRLVVVDDKQNVYFVEPHGGEIKPGGHFRNAGSLPTEPIVAGNDLLAVVGQTLYAVGLDDGATRWKFTAVGGPMRPPTVADDSVYWLVKEDEPAEGFSGALYELDRRTGAVRRTLKLRTFVGPGDALVVDDRLIVGTPPGSKNADDDAAPSIAFPGALGLGGLEWDAARRTAYSGLVDAQGDCVVVAWKIADGRKLWSTPLGASPLHPHEKVWCDGDRLVAPLWSGEIVGLDADDGTVHWRHVPKVPRRGAITVAAGRVYFLQQNGELRVLDVAAGRVTARGALNFDLAPFHCFAPRPIVFGGRIVAATGPLLVAWELPQ